jgi:hypothetical protein
MNLKQIGIRAILIVVYYVLLIPIGLVMRLFGKDFLNKKVDRAAQSYWIARSDAAGSRESLEKQS